jgi:tetratricopeptide (TPR) repeat protein
VAHLRSLPLLELEHEHIAKVFEIGESDGIPYITTEFVEGRSLSKFREEGISISEILSIVDDLSDALSYAHSMGVLHGDLKPSNVIVDSYGSPKITDFGFFRSPETVKKAGVSDEISAAKAGYEFPFYAAPEQVDGNENYIESDIYSIGAILYHFLTGRPPLSNENLTRLCLKIRDEAPRPVRLLNPEVSAPIQAVVLKCLAKRPEQRYHTCEVLKAEIHRLMIGAPVKAETAAVGRVVGLVARIAALILLVAGGVFAFRLAHSWAANRFAESLTAAQTETQPVTPALVEEALKIAKSEGPAAAEKALISGLPELEKISSPAREQCLPGVFYFLARMAEDRGDIPGASSFYRKMLEISPDHPMGLYGAGRMLYLIQDYTGARDRFSRLVAVSKDDPKAHLAYGLSLWGIGDVKAAVEEMRTAVELDPADQDARRWLAQLNAAQ